MSKINSGENNPGFMKVKTLLIYPPGSKLRYYPLLGIPQLKAFLASKGYNSVYTIDMSDSFTSNSWLLKYYKHGIYFFKWLIIARYKIRHSRYYKIVSKGFKHLFLKFTRSCEKNHDIFKSIGSMINFGITDNLPVETKLYKRLKSRIKEHNTNLIGLSIVFPEQLFYSIQLARLVKALNKDIFVVMGGPQITDNIGYLLKYPRVSDFVDFFVVGDGEEPLAKLIYQLENGKSFFEVPNMYYKEETRGYEKSRDTFSCDSRHMIAPDYEGFYYTLLPVRFSSGCFHGSCTFCTYNLFRNHKGSFFLDSASIIAILRELIEKYKIRRFKFIADMLPPAVLAELSNALLRENLKIRWECNTAFVKGFDKAIVDKMAKSGCYFVSMGLESMSARILKLMGKPHSPSQAVEILKIFHGTPIHVRISIIIGFPTETKEEASETLDFLKANRGKLYDSVGIHHFNLQDNTIIFKNPGMFGITQISKDKLRGPRYGYEYQVESGMTREESKIFTEQARKELRLT